MGSVGLEEPREALSPLPGDGTLGTHRLAGWQLPGALGIPAQAGLAPAMRGRVTEALAKHGLLDAPGS